MINLVPQTEIFYRGLYSLETYVPLHLEFVPPLTGLLHG